MSVHLQPSISVDKPMKFNKLFAILTCVTVITLMACEGSEDYSVITVAPSTCVVTNVEMGKISCYVTTKTLEGKDSVYVASITGSNYPMSIDQFGGRIFNVDSLPYGCDASKVTFTTLASSGSLAINSVSQQDVDTFFVGTDSTDLRTPRRVTVYAPNGLAKRTYMLEVRVHQEEGDKFVWHKAASDVPSMAGVALSAAVANEGQLYVYGVEGTQPVVLTALATAPAEWTKTNVDKKLESPVVYDGTFYALADGCLMQSGDGVTWTAVSISLAQPLLTIVAGSEALYGVTTEGFVTSVDGVNWTLQEADEPEYLPTENCAATCLPTVTDPLYEDILVVGTRNGTPVVWKLNVDKTGEHTYVWNYYPELAQNPYPCPEMPQRQVFAYDGATLMMGSQADGMSVVLLSRDNGRTWKQKDLPQLEGVTVPFVSTVDANHYVWVVAQDGQVMKGRFNRLGWVQQDRVFTE